MKQTKKIFPKQKTKRSFVSRHLRLVHEVSPQTSFVNKIPCLYSLCPGNLFMKTKRNKLKVLKGVCLCRLVKTAQVRVRTRVTNVEAKGIMGRRKTAFYFPPSSARKFSSRERRLGTRQNKGYSNSLMISIPSVAIFSIIL